MRNDGGIVTVCFDGENEAVDAMLHRLSRLDGNDAELPGAVVERVEDAAETGDDENSEGTFRIIESVDGNDELRLLPPDIATCPSCVSELFDPNDRRFRHPFISCVSCGARYTIMNAVPYDRERTTMKGFLLCESCEAEYTEEQIAVSPKRGRARAGKIYLPAVRRYAQTICCPDCGPKLIAYGLRNTTDATDETSGRQGVEGRNAPNAFSEYGEAALQLAISYLRDGKIVAVKDVGGYHLCFDAFSADAAKRMRKWKNRERKPFAILFPNVDEIRKYAEVSETEEQILTSPEAPIVLLRFLGDFATNLEKTPSLDAVTAKPFPMDAAVSTTTKMFPYEVLCGSGRLGAFLPSNPVQHLLLTEFPALVMTSGNRGGEPIVTDDEEMCAYLKTGVPDLVLANDREILQGLDDSIYQVAGEQPIRIEDEPHTYIQIIRRARGLVPKPIWISRMLPQDTFAAGGDLKAVFALGRKNAVYMSGHFGDLDDARAKVKRAEAVAHFENLFGINPKAFLCDKHPQYVSAEDAKLRAATLKTVQHHHAHILSVIAEHNLKGAVLGVAFDGTGYGDDGTIWGGEFLLCDDGNHNTTTTATNPSKDNGTLRHTYIRAGHLYSVPLVGGDSAAADAEKTAFCYLYLAKKRGLLTEKATTKTENSAEAAFALPTISQSEYETLSSALAHRINVTKNSSMGRLFDAAAAILDICHENTFEGECPQRLQYAAERYERRREEEKRCGKDITEETPHIEIPLRQSDDTPVENGMTGENGASYENENHAKNANVWHADTVTFLAELYKMKQAGVDADALAYAFHRAVAEMTVQMAKRIWETQFGMEAEVNKQIALSGGTMQNTLLLRLLLPKLEEAGFKVYLNEQVPAGDGGLALGQIYAATVGHSGKETEKCAWHSRER